MDALTYMEETAKDRQSRDIQKLFGILDERFGKTDSEKSRMWMSHFAEPKRKTGGCEGYKDFWSRFIRAIAKLKSMRLDMNGI